MTNDQEDIVDEFNAYFANISKNVETLQMTEAKTEYGLTKSK